MKRQTLSEAYRLIYAYRAGQLPYGSRISRHQMSLLAMLAQDLLPEEPFDCAKLEVLIPRLAAADSLWNQRTMAFTDSFYAWSAAGLRESAELRRREFLNVCPSSWYRGIVTSL